MDYCLEAVLVCVEGCLVDYATLVEHLQLVRLEDQSFVGVRDCSRAQVRQHAGYGSHWELGNLNGFYWGGLGRH